MTWNTTRRGLLSGTAGLLPTSAYGANADYGVERLKDPVTGRAILRYRSPHHETHHYYFISPWSPGERTLVFFQFDRNVEKLTARGHYPGALVTMNVDGSGRRTLAPGLKGHYHVGVNQFWSADGDAVYFTDGVPGARLTRADIASGKLQIPNTPVRCDRLSPDGTLLSCGGGKSWGVYRPAKESYEPLVTLERVIALSPNKAQINGPTLLQNTRFSPAGDRIMIVHKTNDDPPTVIEVYVYDLRGGQLSYLTSNLHHPCWRPDGKAILFVRWNGKQQNIWEVNVETLKERPLHPRHISSVHTSYHPRKQHLVLADTYGGEFGNGLMVLDTNTGNARHLVSIPQGAGADVPADERFPFRNFGLWFPPRKYLNEPRPVWSADGSQVFYTSEESGRINLYIADTSDL